MKDLIYPAKILQKRRRELLKEIHSHSDIILLFNAPHKLRSYDTNFPYRPDSDFLYLTGYMEEGSACLLWKEGNSTLKYHLFVLPRDPVKEHWDGKRLGPVAAKKLTGADEAFPVVELEKKILEWLGTRKKGSSVRLWSNADSHSENRQIFDRMLEKFKPALRAGQSGVEISGNINLKIRKQRLIKDAHEISVLRKASAINVEAHLDVMHSLRPGLRENQVQSILEWNFFNAGCSGNAYHPICAGGDAATILHYNSNNAVLKNGDLLLLDAGCEYQYFASDITRTLPINGKYTQDQRWVMDLVGEAHHEVIRAIKPGLKYTRIHEIAAEVISEGLIKKKLIKGPKKTAVKDLIYKKYFTHGTGHWMGMDVHDPCPYVDDKGNPLTLKAGMVLTVEPGLYFQTGDRSAPKSLRGIGVRIEDDILVTAKGADVLTSGLPRYAKEIESEMARD